MHIHRLPGSPCSTQICIVFRPRAAFACWRQGKLVAQKNLPCSGLGPEGQKHPCHVPSASASASARDCKDSEEWLWAVWSPGLREIWYMIWQRQRNIEAILPRCLIELCQSYTLSFDATETQDIFLHEPHWPRYYYLPSDRNLLIRLSTRRLHVRMNKSSIRADFCTHRRRLQIIG